MDLLVFFYTKGLDIAIVSTISAIIIRLISNRSLKNAQISINREGKKIEYKIQRKYMLTEIRTRQLLEIYPKLHDAVLTAATPYVTLFDTIATRIEETKTSGEALDENQLRLLIDEYFSVNFKEDLLYLKINNVGVFNNLLASSGLFISEEVNTILTDMKKEIMNLFRLIRKEISKGAYKNYNKIQLFDLINKANISVSSLNQDKDHLARRMNKELNPDFN